MGSRQEELRALMKKTKEQNSLKKEQAIKKKVEATIASKPATSSSNVDELYLRGNKNVPLGFFDDSLKEAKVKEVNIEEVSQKQMEKDWEAFQEFVAEVEEDTQKEQRLQQQEAKEKDALEKLENMEYLDRYRQVLEVVTKKRPIAEVTKDQTNNLVDTVTQQLKKKAKAFVEKEEDDCYEDDFDPCNWRSKRL